MRRHLVALGALAAGVLLGLAVLVLPAPAPPGPGFSALRARAHLDVLARAPHSVRDQASLAPVRDYIRGRLEGLGLKPGTLRHPEVTDRSGHRYPLENIAAGIPGRSGSSVLLVSHYDAAPASLGAADDGLGVAAMLEIAGLLARSPEPLENGVRFLFTDAEESGLLGARAEMERNPGLYRDVNLVINLEARGVRGPAVMFETGRRNLATIRLFRKARWPFGYSFAPEVYRRMPNGTDFTVFSRAGLPGMNFAVLDDLSFYHTPRDNPGNVSMASLQHYGEQILPMVRAYAADPALAGKDAFASREDMVYFPCLPGVLVSWPMGWDRALCVFLVLCFHGVMVWNLARGRARILSIAGWFLAWTGLAAAALAAGAGTSFLASRVTGIPWRFTYMPNVPLERPITWVLLFLVALAAYALARRSAGRSALIGAMGLNLLVLAALARVMPGAAFLFSVPLLAAFGSLVLADLTGRPWLALAGAVVPVALFVPVLHLVSLALTLGALAALLLMAALPLGMAAALAADPALRRGARTR
ncbi:M28 family peptidase [Geothrix sp. 21YS21S-2]|uniref:M28 family peptidase n=1 Tax=Geothrix sp. 21YS21S-2 TaxID=3068893 RepID=UPI0027B8C74A|nr:M28 family peptidase [Geothrix sp. 21YS21S-2]